jgi:hypothetical protein
MGAAIDGSTVLDAMPDDWTLAVDAPRRHRMDRAFEAVECHRLSSLRDAKGLVVIITTNVTSGHVTLRCKAIGDFGNSQAARRFRVLAAFFADSDLSRAERFADACPPSLPPFLEGA